LMELVSREFKEATVVSIGHRSELEPFHSRKIILKNGRGGAKIVSDIYLIPKPVLPIKRSRKGFSSLWNSSFASRKISRASAALVSRDQYG
jgi:hypothetical protein